MKDMMQEAIQVFDVVLLDSPPVLAVIDSVIISSVVESAIVIVRAHKTRRKQFFNAVDELKRARANLIGVIVNGADFRKDSGYYSKYYRRYGYGEDGASEPDLGSGTD
jgi:Mrp family chromosome partitioning ATPase